MLAPVLLLATALAFAPGLAQPWAQTRDPVKTQLTVGYADLDLATPDGARAMLARIKGAVAKVCTQPHTPVLPRADTEEWRCRGRVLSKTLEKLNAPLVTAAATGRLQP